MSLALATADRVKSKPRRDARRQRELFNRARRAEAAYARKLRAIGRAVGDLIAAATAAGTEVDWPMLERTLERYADVIRPWARAVAATMINDVRSRDERAWWERSKEMGLELRHLIRGAPLGEHVQRLMDDQVHLITSIPLEAARRVHRIAEGNLYTGARPAKLAAEIAASGEVAKSRATLIARTETARAQTTLTLVRARAVGSTHYVWRTVEDQDVRRTHRKMNGRVIAWDEPPEVEPGKRYHAGCIYNCFTGQTLVWSSRVFRRAFRALYRGPLITLQVGNAVLGVTPGHPILSRRGWMPAELIEEGEELVQIRRRTSQLFVNHHVNQRLRTFCETFEALSSYGRASVTVDNLYGDRIVDNQVEVVGEIPDLAVYSQTTGFETIDDRVVTGSDRRVADNWIERSREKILVSSFASSMKVSASLLDRSFTCHESVGLGLSPGFVTSDLNELPNKSMRNPELMGDRQTAFSSNVTLNDSLHAGARELTVQGSFSSMADDALDKAAWQLELFAKLGSRCALQEAGIDLLPVRGRRVREFSGHVYTLESPTGYYPVGIEGTAAKNCRCFADPIIPDEAFG